jgi:hypothetical protein
MGYVEFGGGMFARCSPPLDQYRFGRGHSFESQRGDRPCFPLRGALTPPEKCDVIP